jgi:electron transport complex protein RnfB
MMDNLVTAIGFMGGLTLLLAAILVLVNKRFFVMEDKRIDQVEEMLPHINCGACGYPGCRAFAEALVKHEVLPGQCNVSSLEEKQLIAAFLNVDTGGTEKVVARLACAGGNNVSRFRADYVGLPSCQAATQVSGGPKVCSWGCLGFGDCETVCNYDAIEMDEHGLPHVSEEKCTGCGDCVKICPKDLFTLEPISHRLWVACKNEEAGDSLLASCEVACTACGRCAMDAPGGLITMQDNLPRINYALPHDTQVPIERCPTGAIVWVNSDDSVTKGRESKKIVRNAALPATGS